MFNRLTWRAQAACVYKAAITGSISIHRGTRHHPNHLFYRTIMAAVPMLASPAANQFVEHEGKVYDTVREGRAYILIPPNTRTAVDPKAKANTSERFLLGHRYSCAANSTYG